jgi:hypothetical protein
MRYPPRGEPRSPLLEAFVLPVIFLTVALAGGLRVGLPDGHLRLLPPPLISLVLAMLLLGVLVRGGVLVGARFLNNRRTALENLSGAVVLVTLAAATAQLFNSVTPETGLLHLVCNAFFVLLLWNTLAAGPRAGRLLHSLMVVFGFAFGLKYIVLAALYDPEGGLAKRVLTTLLEGVTLGSIDYVADAPVTGYVAFATLVLYMIGLYLLSGTTGSLALEGGVEERDGLELPPAERRARRQA